MITKFILTIGASSAYPYVTTSLGERLTTKFYRVLGLLAAVRALIIESATASEFDGVAAAISAGVMSTVGAP